MLAENYNALNNLEKSDNKNNLDDNNETRKYLSGCLELDSPEKAEQIKFLSAESLEGKYKQQYDFLNDKQLANIKIAVVPDELWVKGSQPSESHADQGLILIRESYFNNPDETKKDEIAWMSHELAHCESFNQSLHESEYNRDSQTKAFEDIEGGTYPNNKVELYTFTKQFEYLKNQGVDKNRIKEMLKEEYKEEDFKFFDKVLDQVFK